MESRNTRSSGAASSGRMASSARRPAGVTATTAPRPSWPVFDRRMASLPAPLCQRSTSFQQPGLQVYRVVREMLPRERFGPCIHTRSLRNGLPAQPGGKPNCCWWARS